MSSTISSPMPGKIAKILVKIGDTVNEKSALFIHEAMKMENSIFAESKGVVRKILVREGDTVEQDQPLITIE
jgi:biotin carboxyl carrier protein